MTTPAQAILDKVKWDEVEVTYEELSQENSEWKKDLFKVREVL